MSRFVPAQAPRLAGLLVLAALASCAQNGQMQAPQTQSPGPQRTNPTPGTRSPTAPGPQGTLPNPYTRPE
jgi:hypothetical protein